MITKKIAKTKIYTFIDKCNSFLSLLRRKIKLGHKKKQTKNKGLVKFDIERLVLGLILNHYEFVLNFPMDLTYWVGSFYIVSILFV